MASPVDPGRVVAKKHGQARSPHWATVRDRHIKMEPKCQMCGDAAKLQVHHVIPFHICILLDRPELELDHRNLITLCACKEHMHHELLGHLDDFSSFNPKVRSHKKRFGKLTSAEIEENAVWLKLEKARPKDWGKMTAAQQTAIKTLVSRLFPVITG